ncbi:TPN1 [Candida oxycetoniae]|uniref:Vitamin B6 transporter TPN1 n=1 Tax=Candida oxycetoniae TaxID=497107 RepID=A0AAI9WW98_9ASCO|nr:TPN1 [Candida oxycetoniae]KAI3402995.2 TPN1 [Candida oxycetoniae]
MLTEDAAEKTTSFSNPSAVEKITSPSFTTCSYNSNDCDDDANPATATYQQRKISVVFHYLNLASKKLDSLGVETRGIERIQPYERSTNRTKQLLSVIGLWLSACGGLSSMSTFYLGPLLFGLGLKNTLISGLVGHTLGCFIAAYCSLMGPKSGCRQMVSARYLFGWWFVKLVALVSIIGVMGWSVVNCLVGGQILTSLSNGKIPIWAGIILIAGVSLCVAIGGIKQLMRIEALLSLPVNFAFLMLYIVASQKFNYLTLDDAIDDKATIRGNWLTFFSLCYSITSTWGSIASDYYILFPETTSDIEIFSITLLGIWIPTTFVGVAGILIGNVALTYKPWGDAYASLGMGGLLNEAFRPWGGGGKFLLVLIFLSLISNNILNTYSAAFGVQLAGTGLAKVPRWLWAIALTAVYLVCALVGRDKFATILSNFLPMVGYWISMYFIMLLEENVIFRTQRFRHLYEKEFEQEDEGALETESQLKLRLRIPLKKNQYYNWKIWNDYYRLTRGLAATSAFCIGATGAAVGMAQTYWIGPIARRIGGEYGGDIAMWLCMGFSGISYPILRYLELKFFRR